jgi:hypothetical protein
MPESANPVQPSVTVIEIRPFKGGWQCFEGPGVQPYWTGNTAKEDAIGYATAGAKFGRGEIRGLNHDGKVQTPGGKFQIIQDEQTFECWMFARRLGNKNERLRRCSGHRLTKVSPSSLARSLRRSLALFTDSSVRLTMRQ